MMETLTLGCTADNQNEQILHVAAAEVLGKHQHQQSTVEEDQMMNLSDMTDLSQEIEDIDGSFVPVAKEVIFISLVSQEQALYNPKHENYRNTHKRDTKWLEIADRVGWTEMQCKSKWKAMRDQYCRELKRSKSNAKTNIKWKYFKELDFLRPYALARNYRPRNSLATNSHHINNSNNSNNNTFNCSAGSVTPNGISSEQPKNHNSSPKFPTIKLEAGTPTISFTNCDFSSAKSDTSNNVITEEQLNNVLQQQNDDNNWNYITGTNSNSTNNNTRLDNHTLSETTQHLLSQHVHQQGQQHHAQQQQQQQATDEAFYNALVDCVGQIQQQHEQQLCQQQNSNQEHQQSQQQQQPSNANNDEEDDDPIHTFLNIESYFEKELIALIRNEDVLYNSANPNYRNVKLKLVVWDEIARKLKKTVKQCRLKWKALRDQFIREHKRLRNRNDIESLSKWKHYEALIFLQNFMKQKPSEYVLSKNILQIMPKTEMIENDINEENERLNISNSSPLRTPLENIKCDLSQSQLQMEHMAAVNDGGHQSVGLTQTNGGLTDNLSVNPGSVGGYDDMDIDNYIIGDGGSVVNEHHDDPDNETDTEEDRKSQQDFAVFSNHNTNLSNDMDASAALEQRQQQDQQQHQQQQHINMPSLDLNDNTASVLINPDDLNPTTTANSNNSYPQNPLTNSNNNNITLASAITPLDICTAVTTSNTNQKQVVAPITCEAATNTLPPLVDSNNCSSINTNALNTMNTHVPQQQQQQEDDEVGAFFKAVAMKIRNAKLSPVAFTDLQIDILRVINSSLRNH